MPIFGEFETVGEPHATTQARDYVSTVWKVQKGGQAGRVYALKCMSIRRRRQNLEGGNESQLEADRGMAFIGVIKQVKKVEAEGGRGLAPIYEFGTTGDGVWYVTDFCERLSLKALVTRQGQVDDAVLRHVLHSVVTACQAMGRLCGRSHGNLKLSNVLRGGKSQPLRKTPLLLVDPMPVPSASISRLDQGDRSSVEQTVNNVFEAQDLKAIGEIILQLVEGRVIESGFDYNYPIAASEPWARLGKSAEAWRTLCNQLLDPQLSIEKVNLAWLGQQFKPQASGTLWLAVGGFLLVAGLAGGGVYAYRLKAQGEFTRHFDAAGQASQTGDAVTAAQEIELALHQRPNDGPAQARRKEIQAQLQKAISSNFTAGQQAESQQHWSEAKGCLEKAEALAGAAENPQPSVSALQAELQYAQSMDAGTTALAAKHWDAAGESAKQALGLKPGDAAAQAIWAQVQAMKSAADQTQAALAAQAAENNYAVMLADGQEAYREANYNLAIDKGKAALAIKPGDAAAMQLVNNAMGQVAAQAAQKLAQDYQAAMTAGQQAFQAGNFSLAIEKANAALSLKPDSAEAKQLATTAKTQLDAQLSQQQQEQAYQSALADGRKAFQDANYALALGKANTALSFKADGAEAKQLAADARSRQEAQQAKQQREQAYQAALADGRKAFQAANYALALDKANAALSFQADGAEAKQLAADAKARQDALLAQQQQEQSYQTALAEGRKAFKAADYTAAINQANAALGFKADGAEAKQLAADARAQQAALLAKQQQEQAYQTALADGRTALKQGDFTTALAKANAALGLKADGAEANQLVADVKAQQNALLVKQQHAQAYQAALADGRKAFSAANYSLAIDKANAALAAEPDGAEAKQLAADAKAQQDALLAKQQQEQTYQSALADGTQALKEANYKVAMDKASVALGIKPGDAAASALLTEATKGNDLQKNQSLFANDVAQAKGTAADDPLKALAKIKEAKALQASNPDTIQADPSLPALEQEIAGIRSLDQQLEDLMQRYGVTPKETIRAINPKNSAFKEYSSSEKSDNNQTDLVNLKNLKARYKPAWLNRERTADFTLLENKLNLF